MEPLTASAPARHRWNSIDMARGIAIVAMIIYHFGWDLSFLNLIETDLIRLPAWRWFARLIAGSFLVLSGIGLVLAHGAGIRWRAFLKRLAIVGGAALLVTIATYFAFPQSFIFFGILHAIALSSVLALPFLRAPVLLTLAVAVFVAIGPWIFTASLFDIAWLDWLGLGSVDPVTNDYVPVFPWFAAVLAGVIVARLFIIASPERSSRIPVSGSMSKGIIWAGRHSLPIYLIHQIVLLSLLYGVLQLTGPNPAAEARPFISECEFSCARQGTKAATCTALCACAVRDLRENGLWRKLMSNALSEEDRRLMSRTTQQCLRQIEPSPP